MIITVLLPFAVQFTHSFQKHEHAVCKAQNIIHFDSHEIDCSVLHFKINTNKIDFPSETHLTEKVDINQKILFVETGISSIKIQYKSSRAPPFLLT